jgi:phage terminase small subunit
MGRHRSSAVLKLLNGTARHDASKVRDDAAVRPKDRTPFLPPWEVLDDDEKRVYDFLVAEFVLPAVHGRPDGIMIATLARQIVMRDKSFAKLKEFGPVMRHPKSTKPILQPYFYAYKAHDEAVRKLMFELGFSPLGRLKHAPPMSGSVPSASSWDDID